MKSILVLFLIFLLELIFLFYFILCFYFIFIIIVDNRNSPSVLDSLSITPPMCKSPLTRSVFSTCKSVIRIRKFHVLSPTCIIFHSKFSLFFFNFFFTLLFLFFCIFQHLRNYFYFFAIFFNNFRCFSS